jgi:dolichol-phosphate mannosyltransferase
VNVWILRFLSLKTFLKFAVVGATGVIVNLGFFTLFLALGLNKFIASPIAIELSIISNFLLNNYWTFGDRKTKDRVRVKGVKYNLVSILALFVSFSTFVLLSFVLPDAPPQLHQLIAIVPATVVNYLINSNWTFSHAHESAPEGQDRFESAGKGSNGPAQPKVVD